MRVVFLGFAAEQVGVELLSAELKAAGHDVRLVYHPSLFDDRFQLRLPRLARAFDRRDALIRDAVALAPDVLAFSALTATWRDGRDLLAAIRAQTGCKVVVGGVHASAVPGRVIAEDCVDAVVVGEGDHALPTLLHSLAHGDGHTPIENVWFKAPDGTVVRGPQAGFIQDLDALPFPDKELYAEEVDVRRPYMTLTGRGCPYRCTFCFNNYWARLPARSGVKGGRYVRQRSVENVIGELRRAKARWGIRYVDFQDDVFTVDKAWVRRFLDAYRREVGLPWMCLTHPKYVDEDIVRWMKEAGCTWVQVGIQSVDEHYKARSMKRHETVGDVAWAIDAFRAAGIGVRGDHIFGAAGEPAGSQEAARRFYAEHTPSRISTYWMTYLPGVEITAEALARGDLDAAAVERIERGEGDAFHGWGTVAPDDDRATLAAYEALFRLMPAVPAPLRVRVPASAFARVPPGALKALSTAGDLAIGLAQRNPNHLQFARYYLRQLAKHATG